MTLTAPQQTALEQPVVRKVYFIEFEFLSETTRISTLGQTITWGGHDWLGLGTVGSISQVEESDGLASRALTFTLNNAQPAWLALAAGSVEEYRGRPAKMYMCPLDEGFVLIDTPVRCWSGFMDTIVMGVGKDGDGQISLKCETAAFGLKRRPSLRMNAAQQKKKHPTDTGFDYLTSLIAEPQTWVSINFQKSQS